MTRSIIHMTLHFLVPGLAARLAFSNNRWRAWGIMVCTLAVDLDHLLATPMYDPNRCSIGFHPLHSFGAIAIYVFITILPPTRIVGVGLLIHMALDLTDCLVMRWL